MSSLPLPSSSSSSSSSSASLYLSPPSSLRLPLRLLITLQTISVLLATAQGRQNFTLDDNDPLITYSPFRGWIEMDNPLDAGGSHMVTLDSSSLASFTFTGVYIEFWSALWPTVLSASLSLDGAPAVRVDLQDHNSPVDDSGGETVQSAPMWNSGELENGEHTLIVGTWPGENVTVVDRLVYTALDSSDLPNNPPPITPATRSSTVRSVPSATQSASTAPTTTKSTQTGLSITLGVVCTIFGLGVIYGGWWYWRRRKRRMDSVIIEDAEGMGVGLNGNGNVGGGGGGAQRDMTMSGGAASVLPVSAIASSTAPTMSDSKPNSDPDPNANGSSTSNRRRSKPRPWGVLPRTRPSIDVSSPDDDDPPPLITLSNHSSSSSLSSNHASGSGSGSGSTSPPRRMRPAPPIPAKRSSVQATAAGGGTLSTIPEGQGLGKPLVPVKVYRPSPLNPNSAGVNGAGVGDGASLAPSSRHSTASSLSATSSGSGSQRVLVKPPSVPVKPTRAASLTPGSMGATIHVNSVSPINPVSPSSMQQQRSGRRASQSARESARQNRGVDEEEQ